MIFFRSLKTVSISLVLVACFAVTAHPQKLKTGTSPGFSGVLRAHVVPKRYTTLSSEIDSKIIRLTVRENGAFKKGSLLVELDCGAEAALLDGVQAELGLAESTLTSQERLKQLGSTSIMRLSSAKAEAARIKSEVDRARVVVRRCKIIAPFSGRVANLSVQRHQFVKRGEQLMRIVDPSVLEVEMIIPSDWLASLKAGHPFKLTLDETGKSYAAEITSIGAWIDPVSRSVKITGRIVDASAGLMPGMSGSAVMKPPKPNE